MSGQRLIAGFLALTLLLSGAAFSIPAEAQQAAALFVSPGAGTYGVGQTFSLAVRVDSGGGSGINAGEGQMTFDKAKLQATSISKSGSIFSLWPSEPAFSNSDGSITFAGGSPTAYTGNSGTIVSVTFKALAPGTAEVRFNSGSVLAADGKGTNVLGETRRAVLTIGGSAAPPPSPTPPSSGGGATSRPSAPAVGSATHPDVNQWYAEPDVELEWSLPVGILGISSEFDRVENTNPGVVSEGIAENALFENTEDGIWFFHLRFQNNLGWGDITHRRVLIDTTPPEPFEVKVEQTNDTDPSPKLSFAATDTLAGIAKYEIQIGPGDPLLLTPQEAALAGGTVVGPLAPGTHRIAVIAVDGAGNERSIVSEVVINPIAQPAITNYSEVVETNGVFYVEGVGPERGRIIIRLENAADGDIIETEVLSDADGRWFFIDRSLPRGEYGLSAKAVDSRGAQSTFTEPLAVTVKRAAFFATFGWLIMLLLLLALIAVLTLWYLERKQHEEEMQRIREEVADLRSRLGDVFAALHEEAEEQARGFDKRPSLSEREQKILNHLEEALEISEELIGKEVADVEKLIE